MEEFASFSLQYNQKDCNVIYQIDSEEDNAVITIQLNGQFVATITVYGFIDVIKLDQNPTFSIQLPNLTPLATCLIGCVVKAVIGDAISCFWKVKGNANPVNDFIECMKKKGIGIATSAATCAVDCLS